MDIHELDKAKLQSTQELADIQLAVSEGRAVLNSLEQSLEEHLALRENLGTERVQEAIRASRAALDQLDLNRTELRDYLADVRNLAHALLLFRDELTQLFTEALRIVEEQGKALDAKKAEIDDATKALKLVHLNIQEDRKQCAREMATLAEERRALKDKRDAFERAWAELEAKQTNH